MKKWILNLRWLVLCAVVVSLFTACTKGCSKTPTDTSKPDAISGLKFIPKDNNLIVAGDWKKILASPMGDGIKKNMPPLAQGMSNSMEKFYVFMSLKDAAQAGTKPIPGIILLGKFDESSLLNTAKEAAKEKGGEVVTSNYNSKNLYSNNKEPDMFFSLINSNVLVVGPDAIIKAAIDLAAGKGDGIEANSEVISLIKGMDQNKMIWGIGKIPPGVIPASPQNSGNPLSAMEKVSVVDFAVDINDNKFSLDFGAKTENEEAAKGLVSGVNSYVTLFGAAMAQQDPNVSKLLAGLSVSSSKERFAISLNVEKSVVESLTQKAMNQGGTAVPQ